MGECSVRFLSVSPVRAISVDFVVADVPEFQALARGGYQVLGAAHHFVHGIVVHQVASFDGEDVLLLRGEGLGAVDGEQRIALLDQLAGEIDEDLVDPAVQLAVHFGDTPFVERDARGGTDGVGHGFVFDGAVLHADELLFLGRDFDGAVGQAGIGVGVALFVAGVDGHQLHAAIGGDAGLLATCTRDAWGPPSTAAYARPRRSRTYRTSGHSRTRRPRPRRP